MAEELPVTVVAGGRLFTAFRSVTVEAGFRHAARSFHFEIAAEDGPLETAWIFAAGTQVEVYLGSDLAVRGYVDRYQPKMSGHQRAEISVSGRAKGQDFIDSSAVHATGEFKNKTPVEIAQELDQFGIGISTDQTLDKVPVYRLTPGETGHRAVEKLCRAQGVWCSGQADGAILLTVAGRGRNSALIEGLNIKDGSADHNWANRHSKVIVRGQRPVGSGPVNFEIEATSHDPELQRNRPVVVFEDGDTDQKRAKKRADHRRDSEAGNSLKAHVTAQGFHDDAGVLWTPGFLTYVESPFLGIAQDMAIDHVAWSQSRADGSLSKLTLVDPRALGGQSRKGGKANAAWGSGAGEDE